MISSIAINVLEFAWYVSSKCNDSNFPVSMYFNFGVLLLAKVGVFNYITNEINATIQYDLKFPFIIPIVGTGVIANFQLPLILHNYLSCQMRSSALKLSFGYFITGGITIVVVVGFIALVLGLIFAPTLKIPYIIIKMVRTVFYFLCISAMFVLNCIFIFVSFSQTQYFSPTLLTENLLYWTLVISGLVLFILRKKYNIQIFKPIDESEISKKNGEELHDLIVHNPGRKLSDETPRRPILELQKTEEKYIDGDQTSKNPLSHSSRTQIEGLDQEAGEKWHVPVSERGI